MGNKNKTLSFRFTGGADRKYRYTDQLQQSVGGDFGSSTQFFNSLHWKSVIKTPMRVTFNIDMSPATTNPPNPNTSFRPGIDTAYIQFDGCVTAVEQGKTMWGTDNRLMFTDTDGDGVYSAVWNMKAPSLNQYAYRIVYTSPGGEIWNGSAVTGRRCSQ